MAQQAIADRHQKGLFKNLTYEQCVERYINTVKNGILKIMSKMGISVVSSYRGGCNFEAVGLSRSLIAVYFATMTSRISGIGLPGLEKRTLEVHKKGFDEDIITLPIGGFYRYRKGEDRHAFEATSIHILQSAVGSNNYNLFKKYSEGIKTSQPVSIRDLLSFKSEKKSIYIDKVESISNIRKKFRLH